MQGLCNYHRPCSLRGLTQCRKFPGDNVGKGGNESFATVVTHLVPSRPVTFIPTLQTIIKRYYLEVDYYNTQERFAEYKRWGFLINGHRRRGLPLLLLLLFIFLD